MRNQHEGICEVPKSRKPCYMGQRRRGRGTRSRYAGPPRALLNVTNHQPAVREINTIIDRPYGSGKTMNA